MTSRGEKLGKTTTTRLLVLCKIDFWVFCIRDHRISMNPGLEPILLDLEKLFLLSDDGNSRDQSGKTEIQKFRKNSNKY